MICVMTGRDSRSVRALVPDWKVLDRGYHDVTLVDMNHVDGPEVPVAELDTLRWMWPVPVDSGMSNLQFELERKRRACKQRFRGTQSDSCTYCRKLIKLDMVRHVTNYHFDLAQLWRCPVSWCMQWKGTPQAHTGHHTVRAANFPRGQFPGRCGARLYNHMFLEYRRTFCYLARGVHH